MKMNKWTYILGMPAIVMLCMGDSCQDRQETGQDKEARQTQVIQAQQAVTVGLPAIRNNAEKKELKMLYELRDDPKLVTYTYTIDLNGKRHTVCPTVSYGYPLPYSTQYTAGESVQRWTLASTPDRVAIWGTEKLPQPEPNGLFPPATADGTWVMCLSPDGKSVGPVYVEPHVVAYQWEMPHSD